MEVIALIESARALPYASFIATCDQALVALAFGPEGFAAEAGIEPCRETLSYPAQVVAHAAKSAGRTALGYPSTVGNFTDLINLPEICGQVDALTLTVRC